MRITESHLRNRSTHDTETLMKIQILIASLLPLGGCASSYAPSALSPDHPASPEASGAPPVTRSHTLDVEAEDPVATSTGKEPMEHAGHMKEAPSAPEASPTLAPTAATLYTCPMHPEVTSDKPDQRCPKCNMKLKPVAKTGGKP